MTNQVRALSVGRAILVGTVLVNGPVLALIASPIVVLKKIGDSGGLAIAAAFCGIALAWLWWSLSVPIWRIWAYSRVDDIALLKRRAVEAGLTWPDGHFFSRTEIKSRRVRELERKLAEREHADRE